MYPSCTKRCDLWTHERPCGEKVQIDYWLVPQTFVRRMKCCKVVPKLDYLSNHRGVAFEFTGAAEATEKVARRRSNKGWKPLVNDQKVAQRYQHALNGAFVGQSCRSIDQLGERVVEIAEQHAAAKKYEKSEEIEAIDVKLDELRKLRKALCMEQRKQTAKAIAKLMKKKAKIVAKRKMQKLIKERSGVRRFTAMRSNSNNIAQVMDSDGNLCEDPTDIANAFAE